MFANDCDSDSGWGLQGGKVAVSQPAQALRNVAGHVPVRVLDSVLQRKRRLFLLCGVFIGEFGGIPIAKWKAAGVCKNERIFKATRARPAVYLGDLVGEPANADHLFDRRLRQQCGWRNIIFEPSLDAAVAREFAPRNGHCHALPFLVGFHGVDVGDDQCA